MNNNKAEIRKGFRARGRGLSDKLAATLESGTADGQKAETVHITLGEREITFQRIVVPASEVEGCTYVHEHNPRYKNDVTERSVEKVRRGIRFFQFMPAVALKDKNGKFGLYDGQRRRLAVILEGKGLELLATEDVLSKAEVKELISMIQSFEKLSMRDEGRMFAEYKQEVFEADGVEPSIRDIADAFAVDKSRVERGLRAWSIPVELITLFPSPANITNKQFTSLKKICDTKGSVGLILTPDVIKQISEITENTELESGAKSETAEYSDLFDDFTEVHEKIIAILHQSTPVVSAKRDASQKIAQDPSNRNRWIKVNTTGKKVVVNMSHPTNEERERLVAFLKELFGE